MTSDSNSEYDRFATLVDKVLTVSKPEMDRRREEYRQESMQKPVRPGRKPKITPVSR